MSACILQLAAPQTQKKATWTPSDRDRVIFHWVKFQGHPQTWVADQLEISQSTVSRIVERYEHWIARGGPGLTGGLSHEEQAGYQRWLTYERNELILASCLRIATDMERQTDVSRTTITRSNLSPTQENEVKTYHETLDRSASAARFLRLAHRINMDQLKLRERAPLPLLETRTDDEADDLLEVDPAQTPNHSSRSEDSEALEPVVSGAQVVSGSSDPVVSGSSDPVVSGSSDPVVSGSPDPDTTSNDTHSQPPASLHTVHSAQQPISYLTPDTTATSCDSLRSEKSSAPAYHDWNSPPKSIAQEYIPPTLSPQCPATAYG